MNFIERGQCDFPMGGILMKAVLGLFTNGELSYNLCKNHPLAILYFGSVYRDGIGTWSASRDFK